MLEDLKLLLGLSDDSKDELLELIIKQAQTFAKAYTGLEGLTPALKTCVVKMAVIDYNRMGTEGLNSESYSGTSYNYDNDYPPTILSMLDNIKSTQGNSVGIFW